MISDIGLRPIIFSVNCCIATILALFVAFSLDLRVPGWAMTTVYLTSQPLSGVMRAKAVYRAIGTFVGGVAMVAIVPNLVDAPELTTLAIILWVALCVFVSLLDRTPRSYMFVLSGYTAALIGFPSVLAPGTVFDTAVSRVEEITLGVVCAAVVHSLIFPKSALSAFEQKLRSAIADARRWLAEGLTKAPTREVEMERLDRRRYYRALFARHEFTLRHVAASSGYGHDSRLRPQDRGAVAAGRRNRGSSDGASRYWAARRQTVAGAGGRLRLAAVGSARRSPARRGAEGRLRRGDAVRRAAIALGGSRDGQSHRAADRADRLRQAYLDFAAYLADPTQAPSAEIRAAAAQIGPKPMHTDPGIALLSALAAAVAMGICAFFWIATAWPEGAGAIAFAAVSCTLFASLDDPTPAIRSIALFWGCAFHLCSSINSSCCRRSTGSSRFARCSELC